jgi:AraC family transcriptional regulator of adaptative response/methylated-DNA-[protein]-cysteine methyltransferase
MLSAMTRPAPTARPTAPSAEDARYAAIGRRDAAADGSFVYGVRSTGVYCRPSCAARPARRENISFHETCAAAERAGFRACLRCRPNEPSRAERHAAIVAQACRQIEAAETAPPLATLAASAGMGAHHLRQLFKEVTGVTPKAYAGSRQAARLEAGLQAGGRVTDTIYDAGFAAPSRFYAAAKTRLGMTPKTYRDAGAGLRIRFAVGACSLGAILVAATDKGICAILLGDDPETLVRDLQDRFARAELEGGEPGFERMVSAAVGLVEAPAKGLDLPLDIGGTAFQQRVWQALRAIPAGATASYAEVAAAIGQPAAARAVAQACAANALAVAIPCHRVVRTDGALSGYRWGVARKRDLLAREGEATRIGKPDR